MEPVFQLAPSKAKSRRAPSFSRLCEEKARKGWETTKSSRPSRAAVPASEEGYILLAAIFFLTLLVIALAVAAPSVAKSIERDREVETFHRGMQYRRAVQLYYRKFHAYPPTADALVNTNQIRYLRKKYLDPITGKDDWKPVLYGQNKTPTAMGFFGQPLSGGASSIAGTGPSGGNGLGGSSGSSGASGTSPTTSSPFGGSLIFSSQDNGSGSSPSTGTSGATAGSTGDTSGTGSGSTGAAGSTGSGTSSSGTSTGLTGQTFGGAGIIGFSPASPKQSILVYKKKNHFSDWEFTYDPLSDMKTITGGNTGAVGQPASSTSTPAGSSAFGSSTFGSSTFGSSSSPSSTTSTTPTTPQQ